MSDAVAEPAPRVPGSPYAVGNPGRAGVEVRATALVDAADVADTVLDAVALTGLELRAASVRGLSHRQFGEPRQDAYSLGTSADPLVLTVCDGVGSLPRSHEAARHVCARVHELVGTDEAVPWNTVFQTLSDELDALDGRTDPSVRRSLATTVATAVLRRAPTGDIAVSLAWIGDSAAYVLRGGHWLAVTQPDAAEERELASTSTRALPSATPHHAAFELTLCPGDLFLLTTDGVGSPLGRGGGVVGAALAEWWASPPAALDFAAQIGFNRKGFFDDRTAICVWVHGPADPGYPVPVPVPEGSP